MGAEGNRNRADAGAGGDVRPAVTVFLDEDPRHARKVALKVLRPERAMAFGASRGMFYLLYEPSGITYVAHRTAARSMQAEAEANKEVLAKYGLSEAVLQVFGQLLDQFDAVVKLGSDGRAAHIEATKRLEALAMEARQIVRGGRAEPVPVQERRAGAGARVNASGVRGRAVGSASEETHGPALTPEAGGDVRPAA
jgi:hypothetical protein